MDCLKQEKFAKGLISILCQVKSNGKKSGVLMVEGISKNICLLLSKV